MSITCFVFDFAPDKRVDCLVEVNRRSIEDNAGNKRNQFKVKFSLVADGFMNHVGEMFNKTQKDERFCFDFYDNSKTGKTFTDASIDNIKLSTKAGDIIDLEATFSAIEGNQILWSGTDESELQKVLFANNCSVLLTDDCKDTIDGTSLVSLVFVAQKNQPVINGSMTALLSSLQFSNKSKPMQVIKRCAGDSSIDFGYFSKDKTIDWFIRLVEVTCRVTRRNVDDGFDFAEVSFTGKKI